MATLTFERRATAKLLAAVAFAIAFAACTAVAFAACARPVYAHAAQLSAGTGTEDAALTEPAALTAQAAKKETVYVVTSKTEDAWGWRTTTTMKYDKGGLLKKTASKSVETSTGKKKETETTTYSYKKGSLVGKKGKRDWSYGSSTNWTTMYTLDKKGRATKAVTTNKTRGLGESNRKTYTATYKNGKPAKVTRADSQRMYENSDGNVEKQPDCILKREFKYKGGKVVSAKNSSKEGDGRWFSYTNKYKYDKHGNMVGSSLSLTYGKNGTATKRSFTGGSTTFKYKKVKVSASMADKVRAQQWALVNEWDFSGALGIDYILR